MFYVFCLYNNYLYSRKQVNQQENPKCVLSFICDFLFLALHIVSLSFIFASINNFRKYE